MLFTTGHGKLSRLKNSNEKEISEVNILCNMFANENNKESWERVSLKYTIAQLFLFCTPVAKRTQGFLLHSIRRKGVKSVTIPSIALSFKQSVSSNHSRV